MEEPFTPVAWLDFLIGGNVWIDFSQADKFQDSFAELIKRVNSIEQTLATYPRKFLTVLLQIKFTHITGETPPVTPTVDPLSTTTPVPTVGNFDTILSNFKTWVEQNRHDLKRSNRKQSAQLINQLIEALRDDSSNPNDEDKRDFLRLLSSMIKDRNKSLKSFFHSSSTSNYLIMKGVLFIMALWAVRVVFKTD